MKKNKRRKIIFILIILCLIAAVILGIIYYKVKKEKEQTGKPLTPVVDPKEDNVLNISGFGIFFEKYSGHLKSSEIAKKLDEITTKLLPSMFDEIKDYDDKQLENYYNSNNLVIIKDYGISDFNEFSIFIRSLKEVNVDLSTWYRLDLIKDTFKDNSDKEGYASIEYEVSFKNDQKIKFLLYVAKNASINPTYIIVKV